MDGNSAGVFDIAPELGLREEELRLIYKSYAAFARMPVYEELKAFGLIASERRKKAEGYCFSSVETESAAVAETFDDLKAKVLAMRGKDGMPVSFEESADILGEYMGMIGRSDESLSLASCGDALDRLITDGDGRAVFAFGGSKPFEKARRAADVSYENTAILYLDDSDAQEGSGVTELFVSEGFRNLNKAVVQIGEYGILGALCRFGGLKGAEADITRLPCADGCDPVESFRGKYLVMIRRESVGPLTFLGGMYGIKPIYFAYPIADGRISIFNGSPISFTIETLRAFMSCKTEVAPVIGVTDGGYDCGAVALSAVLRLCLRTRSHRHPARVC